jgi:acetyltransferase
MQMLEKSSVPLFTSPNQCAKALAASLTYGGFLEGRADEKPVGISTSPSDRGRIEAILESSGRIVTEDLGKAILSAYGIAIPSEKLSRSLDEAKEMAKEIGYPVALKIVSPQIAHKTEAGGLRLDIGDEEALSFAYTQILDNAKEYDPHAEIKGVLVQEMVKPGKEVIVGMLQDSQFGPMILFGLGGVFVEVLKDFSLRHTSLTERDAWSMIREIRGYPILGGVRGDISSDLPAIVKVLLAVSQLATDFQDFISSMDINPLVVYPEGEGLKVLDCLFVKKNGK